LYHSPDGHYLSDECSVSEGEKSSEGIMQFRVQSSGGIIGEE
jgi:hypothetical protein